MGRISTFENPASFAYFLKDEGVIAAPVAAEFGYSMDCGRQRFLQTKLGCTKTSKLFVDAITITIRAGKRQVWNKEIVSNKVSWILENKGNLDPVNCGINGESSLITSSMSTLNNKNKKRIESS